MHGFRDSGVRSIYLAFPSDSSERCGYTSPLSPRGGSIATIDQSVHVFLNSRFPFTTKQERCTKDRGASLLNRYRIMDVLRHEGERPILFLRLGKARAAR